VSQPERRLHRTRRPRRAESQDHHSPGAHVHAQAAPDRPSATASLWSGSRRDAVMRSNLDARHRDPRRLRANGDPRPGPDATRWCVGIAVDPERGHFYGRKKRSGEGGLGRPPSARTSKSRKVKNAAIATDIEYCRRLAGAIDLSSDLKPATVLDDRGDPPRRQHREPRPMDADPGSGRPRRFCTST